MFSAAEETVSTYDMSHRSKIEMRFKAMATSPPDILEQLPRLGPRFDARCAYRGEEQSGSCPISAPPSLDLGRVRG